MISPRGLSSLEGAAQVGPGVSAAVIQASP